MDSSDNVNVSHECVMHEKRIYRVCFNEEYLITFEKLKDFVVDVFRFPPAALFQLMCLGEDEVCVIVPDDEDLHVLLSTAGTLQVKVVRNCSSFIVNVVHGDTFRSLILPPDELRFCYEELHNRVRDIFKLRSSVRFVFSYKDPDLPGLYMPVENHEQLKYVLLKESSRRQRLDILITEDDDIHINPPIVRNPCSYIVKVSYNKLFRRLVLDADDLKDSYKKFRYRILELFNLPSHCQVELSYHDEDGDFIIMSKGDTLEDALVRQSLNPLRVNLIKLRE